MNHTGSSGSMEAEAAKLMWARSVELMDARYTSKPVSHTHGGFGYEDSLRLLSSYKSSTCHLTLAVKREYIFLREHPFNAADSKHDNSDFSTRPERYYSNKSVQQVSVWGVYTINRISD